MRKYKVCLCQGCIDYMKEENYNYWTIPLEDLEITLVNSIEECDNTTFADMERNEDWFA